MWYCKICWLACKPNAKYCLKCWRILRENQSHARKIGIKYWVNLCPLCYNKKQEGEKFCKKCAMLMDKPKMILSTKIKNMEEREYIDLTYTYVMKDPKFFRRKKKDFVSFKVLEIELKKWQILTQNLEILYSQWVPKRERYESKENYWKEKLLPIFRAKYERWRDNQIRFMVDVAVEWMKVWAI